MPGYVTGGAVPPDSSAYVDRRFEETAYAELTAGNWVVLLAPRQQGKTSALVRLRDRLEEEGFRATIIDFQAYGASSSYEAFLGWICERLAVGLGVSPAVGAVARDDLEIRLGEVLGSVPNAAIVLDEVSAVPHAHQRRFFSQLRALHN